MTVLHDLLNHAAARTVLANPNSTPEDVRIARTTLGLPTQAPTIVALDVPDVDRLEVCDAETGDRHESIDLGPFDGVYLRLRSADLVVVADQLHRLADQMIDLVLDGRQAKMDAEKVECPGCRTRIAPDDISCGTPRCEAIAAMDAQL